MLQYLLFPLFLLVALTAATSNSNSNSNSQTSTTTSTGCTAVLNGDTRQCCPTTGECQDSSCVVFGFPNSARANCHTSGANPNCRGLYCAWQNTSCPLVDGRHCYGTVACSDGSSSCSQFGSLCLQDGSSANFKICGDACNNDNQCPSGTYCDKSGSVNVCTDLPISPSPNPSLSPSPRNRGRPDEDIDAVRPCSGICPPDNAECSSYLNFVSQGNLEADVPSCSNPNALADVLSEYQCSRQNPNCNAVVCQKFIPDSVISSLQGVKC